MIQSSWTPMIAGGDAPMWRRLLEAIERDVAGGVLEHGCKLPPHRELAHRMGLGVGTVSRAYLEAERRAIVASHVGRGTFVTRATPNRPRIARSPTIDMARNVPPLQPAQAYLERTLDALRRRGDVALLVKYSDAAGTEAVREAGASWLRQYGRLERASARRLIQTNGGQQALMLACSSFARVGDAILCDVATYPGNRVIADYGGWRLRGVPSDDRGMDPAQLDQAAAETGARLVVLIPTLQNPTAITLDQRRREEIVAVARERGLIIVEDDIYRVFGRAEDPVPFAALAPERTIHVSSVSKALAPGLRLGFLVPPEDESIFQRLLLGAEAIGYCPPAAGGLIFKQWMEDGIAERILNEVRSEVASRNLLARGILGSAIREPHSAHSLHVWLPMSADRAGLVASRALQHNVEVTPPEAPFVDPSAVCGLRLCLGSAPDAGSVEHALRVVKSALDEGGTMSTRGIV